MFKISIPVYPFRTPTLQWIESLRWLRTSRRRNEFSLRSYTQGIIRELFGDSDEVKVCPLLNASLRVAQEIQTHAIVSKEPSYHNQWHAADVLCSVVALIKAEEQRGGHVAALWAKSLVLSAVSHDFMHPGGVNMQPFEIEQLSLMHLQDFWRGCGMSVDQLERMRQLVLHTDVSTVPDNHRRVVGREFEFDLDWTTVLMNEADIAASCSPEFGPELDQQLAEEWRNCGHWKESHTVTVEDRQHFLRSVLFSSPASAVLGWSSMVELQI